jgi:surface protein
MALTPHSSLLSRLPAIYLQITTMKSFQHVLLSSLVLFAMQDQGAVATDVCHNSPTDESQCQDPPLNFEVNGNTRNCVWVAQKPEQRCKMSGIKSHCPVTCWAGSFKPEDNAELKGAVTDWIADPTAAAIKYGPINDWDTSLITDMSYLFSGERSFNDDLSNWNTAAVTNMKCMFFKAISFNRDLSDWNTAAVTTMQLMFYEVSSFNGDLSKWNVAAVTNMSAMFSGTTLSQVSAFNQDLSKWNVAAVTDMQSMFNRASAFNHDLSKWNTAAVITMGYMFREASSFNQELCWSLKEGVFATGMFDGSGGSFGCP